MTSTYLIIVVAHVVVVHVLILKGQDNLSKVSGNEQMVLGVDKFQKGHRLACQANVHGDVSLRIPEWF